MKKRIRLTSFLLGGALLVALCYLLLLRLTSFPGLPCIFHQWTGLLCPGCGLTRAMVALSRGELRTALSYNPLLPLYVLYGGWLAGGTAWKYLKKKEAFSLPGPLSIHIAMLVAVALFWVVRTMA